MTLQPSTRRPVAPPPSPGEELLLALAGIAVAAGAWYWVATGLAGWAATGRWPSLPLSQLATALRGLPHHLSDPAAAWPGGPAGTSSSSAAGRPLSAAVFYLATAAGLCVAALLGRRLRPANRRAGARWARSRDLRTISVRRRGHAGRLVLGRSGGGIGAGRLVATEARHSVLVIGPTQSGKTTGLAIPAILEWAGPVVATSVKDDLAAVTAAWRSGRGPCWLFDPTLSAGTASRPRSRWSPLSECETWSAAQKMASWLVESTPGRRGMADAAFWYTTAGKQLAPLLLAARRAGLTMADVVRWTDSQDYEEPMRLLELAGEDDAVVALTACAGRDERIRSSVSTTLETVLMPFVDPLVAASTATSDVDLHELLTAGGTLFLCGPSHEQNRVQGLFAGLVSAVVAEVVAITAATGRALDPPLLLVLDEAANIAPIRDLDTLASTGAGLGIQLVTVCQDLAQLGARYDPERARTIANNHRAKLLLSGVSDLGTLDLVSGLAGEQAVREETTTHDMGGKGGSRSISTTLRRLAPADQLRRTEPGRGVLVYGHLPPATLRLRPWYEDRALRRRARA